MPLLWTTWAAVVFGAFFLACFLEVNGARKGFQGANGIFIFASGILGAFAVPVLFVGTWIGADLWTATKVSLAGAIGYAAVFALGLHLASKMVQRIADGAAGRR